MTFFIEKAFLKNGCTVTYCICGVAAHIQREHQPICGNGARERASMCYFLESDEMIIPTNPQTHPSLGKQTLASLFYKSCIELT